MGVLFFCTKKLLEPGRWMTEQLRFYISAWSAVIA
jgi:hypothetical protein